MRSMCKPAGGAHRIILTVRVQLHRCRAAFNQAKPMPSGQLSWKTIREEHAVVDAAICVSVKHRGPAEHLGSCTLHVSKR